MLKVRVEDIAIITVKPKISATVYQYVIRTEDSYGYTRVYFIDVEKYDKEKFINAVKLDYAGRYAIPVSEVEVEFLVEPPRVS